MHKCLVALPGRQAAEHRRGGGREMVSISWVEGRTGGAARMPGVATSREVRAREPQPRTPQRGLARGVNTRDGPGRVFSGLLIEKPARFVYC